MSNARFTILQARAISDSRVSNTQFRTLAALGMYGDQDGWCYPKLSTLGKLLCKSKQAVSRDLQELERLGYVEIRHQYRDDGSQGVNLYRLVFDSIPPRQRGDDGGQRDVDTRQLNAVDGGSTSEVDALTTHINDPYEYSGGGGEIHPARPNIYSVYEQEIGPLTPMISEALKDAVEDHTEQWVVAAIREASTHNARNWSYIRAILARWRRDGYGSSKSNGKSKQPVAAEPAGFAAIREYMEDLSNGNS